MEWLALREPAGHKDTLSLSPDFDDNLRQALRREAELLVESVAREDRPVTELLSSDYTFVDERLARHYGVAGVRGSRFRRVQRTPELDARRGMPTIDAGQFVHDLTMRLLAQARGREPLPTIFTLVRSLSIRGQCGK